MKLMMRENYIKVIENSVGTHMFRNLYAEIDGGRKDITNDGELSCALFVSSVLYLFKMVNSVHATVSSTVKDLREFGWKETNNPKAGDIIVWKNRETESGLHKHIGFITSDGQAISNDDDEKMPIKQDLNFKGREVDFVLSYEL